MPSKHAAWLVFFLPLVLLGQSDSGSNFRLSAPPSAPRVSRSEARRELLFPPHRDGAALQRGNFPLAGLPADPLFSFLAQYDSGGGVTSSVVVADVNGDGKPDLLIANVCDAELDCQYGTIGVLLGNGDGTFQPAVSYDSGGLGADFLAVADVNGDGKPDIIVANRCDEISGNCANGNVGVLLGNGDGTFQPAVTYNSGVYGAVYSVAVADLKGTGKLDLVLAVDCSEESCNSGTAVDVLFGNGDGTFQPAVTYASGGLDANSVAVADINGDGKPDIIVTNSCADSTCANGNVGVLLGNCDGTFQPAVTYGSGGLDADSVAVADVNGDGKPDLLVANNCAFDQLECANGSAGVLLGNGDGTFQSAVSYLSPGQSAETLMVGDVNQDGKPDLLVYNDSVLTFGPYDGVVNLMLGNGDGTFQAASGYDFGVGGSAHAPGDAFALADVNGDGKPDLLVTSTCGPDSCNIGGVGVFLNISLAPASTTLSTSSNPAVTGKSVTFTVAVSSPAGTPTGKVQFLNNGTVLATRWLTSGTARYTTSKLPAGANSITAVYEGDSKHNSNTSTPVNQFMLAASTIQLSSASNPSPYGQAVTFTAVVTSALGAPPDGEPVTFMKGQTVLGTANLNSGSAILPISTLTAGLHAVKAVYGGDSNLSPSTSKAVEQVVSKP